METAEEWLWIGARRGAVTSHDDCYATCVVAFVAGTNPFWHSGGAGPSSGAARGGCWSDVDLKPHVDGVLGHAADAPVPRG